MTLVVGVDSSTQSCKVLVRDADTGALVRQATAPHPDGTEVDPQAWWDALHAALTDADVAWDSAGDVAALSVGGQQHGMVALDAEGEVVRPALLWNDTRSAEAARALTRELGDSEDAGRRAWVDACGSALVAAFTVAKLRWLADHEPEAAARVAAVVLPHDWLTWKLSGSTDLHDLTTDRSEASGTGYWDPVGGDYRYDLLSLALRRDVTADDVALPRVAAPFEVVGRTPGGIALGPGCGDNAGAALGLHLGVGDAMVSLGTSGVVAAVTCAPAGDVTGTVTGFADGSGRYLPLACTLNASRVLDAARRLLGVDHAEFDRLALAAEPGAGGLVHVPYLEGERTPDLPDATGSLFGMTLASTTRENLARAAVEGLLYHLGECVDAVRGLGLPVERATLVGGAVRSRAVVDLASGCLGVPVAVPTPGEYVADGAALQAATALAGADRPLDWPLDAPEPHDDPPQDAVRERYRTHAARVARDPS
ncbi:xylulokinase [Mobilicoccus pelagius]|uniref:Xylulose kinase n=1 Tax=Mobilicoccus pelagius NBRC 104925 TaxID=1089455 RepID=H5URL3_9MICO|nr:FGGY family carbohydrate kinase [Mobilicoccus pelagius]GAB48371.1 xylulokinase [Mobilicoccus pelagius NBRC 104925]